MMLGLSGGRGGLGWVLSWVQRSAGSRWSVRPAASPAPLATISPAQVFGQFDPKPAQEGQAAVTRNTASQGRYPRGPPLPPPQ